MLIAGVNSGKKLQLSNCTEEAQYIVDFLIKKCDFFVLILQNTEKPFLLKINTSLSLNVPLLNLYQ
jgi:hypothetical protein